ncbi:MAG: fibronectin type III domain-containing protein, partial [Bacteroidales bacterium]|nr:fibronectin type III domain-containing protein [Bacteroidales bacterium]
DDETNLYTSTTKSYSFTGLTPETTYTAKVRGYYSDGEDGQSDWSLPVSFTPTNIYSFTVNDGTNTNSVVPIYGYNVDLLTSSQFIIPSTSLTDITYAYLQKMTFYTSATATNWGAAQFNVYVTEVEGTTISGYNDWNTMDQVYAGSLSVSDGTMVITLDNQYQYLGGNLLIGIKQTVKGGSTPTPWYGIYASETAYAGYANDWGSYDNKYGFLPKLTFNYLPGEEPTCMRPTQLAVSDIEKRAATLSWSQADDATAWQVCLNGDEDNLIDVTTNPCTLELEPETQYTAKVRANCGEGDFSEWSKAVSFTTPVACNVPTNVTITDIDTETAFVSWEDTGEDLWEICINDDETNIIESWGYPDQLYDLSPDTEYSVKVRAYCSDEETFSDWSTPVTFTTLPTCIAPTGLTASNITKETATLTWTENGSASAWQLCINNEEDKLVDVTANPYTLTSLDPETAYSVKVRANCGDTDGNSAWSDAVSFTTLAACFAPTGLTASDITKEGATLSWTENGEAEEWTVAYKSSAAESFTEVVASTNPFTLTGLADETTYTVKVRPNCSDEAIKWSDEINFTTISACPTPTALTATNPTHSTVDLSWTGSTDVESYTVRYQVAASIETPFIEDFEEETSYDNWNAYGVVNNNTGDRFGRITQAARTGSYGFSFSSYTYATDYNQYLISPELNATGNLVYYYKRSSSNGVEKFKVGYSTSSNDLNDFTWSAEIKASSDTWESNTLSLPEDVKYIAFHYYSNFAYQLFIDDITIGAYEVPAGDWMTATASQANTQLTGLAANTTYNVQVKSNCSDPEVWSDVTSFTTAEAFTGKTFVTEGNWDVAANWNPAGVPTIEDNVILAANATIPSRVVAAANQITTGTYTLTIADGGQLQTKTNVTATVQKAITGYGSANANTNNGYVLIGNPTTTAYNPELAGLTTGNYDLYQFDGSGGDDEKEWRNYETTPFTMSDNIGYLYANEADVTLSFTGEVKASYNATSTYYAVNLADYDFGSWWAYANPFVCDAYLNTTSTAMAFYRMNGDGNGFIAAIGAIAPMEGIFVQCSSEFDSFDFTTTSAKSNSSLLNINLSKSARSAQVTDRAIVRFGEGNSLEKFCFSDNTAKVYIPQDGTDYAVVNAGNIGELPVNFKAESNGNYTLSFNNEEVEFSYLHLIDHLTGADVDLLANPSYSFEAKSTDYANRFKLAFSTGTSANDDDFAIVSNNNLKIFGIEGNATLKVMDLNGRTISTESFNGSYDKTFNLSSGIYMIQLIQGTEVKTQKIVL